MNPRNVGVSDLYSAASMTLLKRPAYDNDDDLGAAASSSRSNGKRSRREKVTIERSVGAEPDSANAASELAAVKWQELQKNTHTNYTVAKCWACSNSDHGKNRELYPTVAGLFDLFYNEYHCRDMEELCELVHTYHEQEIRAKYLRRGQDCAEFTPQMVQDHFLHHSLNPSVEIGQQLRQLQTLETLLRDQVSKKNAETGEIVPDYKAIDMLLKIQKQTQGALLLNPKQMNFHDEGSSVIK